MVSSGSTTRYLLRNAHLATLDPARAGMGEIANGVVAVDGGRIAFTGNEADCPAQFCASKPWTARAGW